MKIPTPVFVLLIATTGAFGWWAARTITPASSPPAKGERGGTPSERKPLFYQSAMHPWIKSDRPGKCTICGMELTPIFEGDAGFDTAPGMVTLTSNSISVLHVETSTIRRGALTKTLRVAGTLDDDDTRHRFLSAWVGGRVEELAVDHLGAEVAAGQPLARFYSPMLLEAERQFLALMPHGKDGQTLPEQEFLRDAAAQRLRQLGLTDRQIAALPGKAPTNLLTEILAPVSGTVLNRFVYAGQYVMEGERLFELADLSTLWFRFDAYEQDLAWLEPGQDVEVTSPSVPGRTFVAPIRFIEPSLVETTRSAKVRVEIPNPLVEGASPPRRLLRHRIYAEGRVRVTSPEVLLIPRSAVLSADGRPVVYLDRSGGTYEQRRIRLGRTGDLDAEVLGGLEPGDRVVTTGNLLIDAQAQLNQAVQQAPANDSSGASPSHPAHLPALSKAQSDAVLAFLNSADAARQALAADDLAAYHQAGSGLHETADLLTKPLEGTPWLDLVRGVQGKAHLGTAPDLRSARRDFHGLAQPLVELVAALRHDGGEGFRDLHIYQCPMTAEAFDGAPSRARWFQPAGPLRNPWFGREMLECGVEVSP